MSCQYDERGHVITETRILAGGLGVFVTGWRYNAAGMLSEMFYPADDQGILRQAQDGQRRTRQLRLQRPDGAGRKPSPTPDPFLAQFVRGRGRMAG
jgi:hypothetical protein